MYVFETLGLITVFFLFFFSYLQKHFFMTAPSFHPDTTYGCGQEAASAVPGQGCSTAQCPSLKADGMFFSVPNTSVMDACYQFFLFLKKCIAFVMNGKEYLILSCIGRNTRFLSNIKLLGWIRNIISSLLFEMSLPWKKVQQAHSRTVITAPYKNTGASNPRNDSDIISLWSEENNLLYIFFMEFWDELPITDLQNLSC